ncbi:MULTISPECIES: permease prefix domain 1-containing protein [Heyndrickxia]|uniref:permease prefix domain 1-containing protein n=1 Tax=Heyndrickxia TaxID=2837504 RepID=UPI0006EBEB67|nr:permease prefix domain 1-containing protein [Heyndrickxia shackletonii]
MRQIDVFIDSVYQNFDGNKEDINELKIEMKNHLLEAVHELKLEGKTETDAVKIAIERFGGEKEIQTVIGQLFVAQKLFARRLLYCALFFLVLSLLIFGTIMSIEKINQNERHKINNDISMILSDVNSTISKEKQDKIKSLIQGTDQVSKVEIYNIENIADRFNYPGTAKPEFKYERKIWAPKTRFIDLNREGNGDDKWFIFITYRSIDNLAVLSLLGIVFSIPLFLIWGIINVYHRRSVIFKS